MGLPALLFYFLNGFHAAVLHLWSHRLREMVHKALDYARKYRIPNAREPMFAFNRRNAQLDISIRCAPSHMLLPD